VAPSSITRAKLNTKLGRSDPYRFAIARGANENATKSMFLEGILFGWGTWSQINLTKLLIWRLYREKPA
jgi:hypothetical protein